MAKDHVCQRRSRSAGKHPWIVRKLAVAVTVAVAGYAAYVYAARFCRDMLVRSDRALGSRATGAAFLAVFGCLFLFATWCYLVLITTSPGHACLHVPTTTRPGYEHGDAADVQYPPSFGSAQGKTISRLEQGPGPSELTLPSRPPIPPPMFTRRPTTTPVLLPEYRYCSKCQIIKPSRTHHCRVCGTCVLKYDHHCPWIGQCVGAYNQKFFVNFLGWATVFWLWTFATLLGLNVKPRTSTARLDPQQVAVIALSGLFGLFCTLVLASQIHLILLNQTTVESLKFRSMRDREQELLGQMHRWYHMCAKRRTRKQWDSEWGRIGVEGNLWWQGSLRANWLSVMGSNPWRWILPVGRPLDDGMTFPTNPRFDSAGRWRKRKEWPPELQ